MQIKSLLWHTTNIGVMPNLVSVAGGGYLNNELDLGAVAEDIEASVKKYEPERHPALLIKFNQDGATVMLFSSGAYNIAGASSIEQLHDTHRHLAETIKSMLNTEIKYEEKCEVRNLIYVDDYGSSVDLEKLITVLGIENIEYEPETFPSLDYRSPHNEGVFKIFSTGKIIMTGETNTDTIDEAFNQLKNDIQEIERPN